MSTHASLRLLMPMLGLLLLAQGAFAACATPTGAPGDMTYSTSANVMVYCDGTNWMSMAGGVSLTVNTSGGGADNLGDHTATQDLNLNGHDLTNGAAATFTGLGNFGSILDSGGLTVVGAASLTTVSTSLIQIGSGAGAACAAEINGALRYNSPSSTLEICTGTTWTGLAAGTLTGSGVSGGSATAVAFWNGPSSLTYESATTSGLYWDHSNGRLGIGTNAPQRTLHMVGPQGTVPAFPSGMGTKDYAVFENNDNLNLAIVVSSTGSAGMKFYKSGGTSFAGYTLYDMSTDSLRFATNGLERARIDSAGYLGIGLITPTTPLHVSGTATMNMANLVSQTFPILTGSGGNKIVSGTSNVTVTNTGTTRVELNGGGTMAAWIASDGLLYMQSGILSVNGGFIGLGAKWTGGSWVNTTSGQGGSAIRNSSGVFQIYAGSNPGTAGSAFTDFNPHFQIAANGVTTIWGTSTCTIGSGTGTTSCTSDRRLKNQIRPIDGALDKLLRITGVTFHWKDKSKSRPRHIGVIAQDVEKVFPEAVSEVSDTTLGTAKTVDYAVLVAPVIEAMKELKADNDNLKSNDASLRKDIDDLRQQLRDLKQQAK